jgi:hypothetical protein
LDQGFPQLAKSLVGGGRERAAITRRRPARGAAEPGLSEDELAALMELVDRLTPRQKQHLEAHLHRDRPFKGTASAERWLRGQIRRKALE